MKLVLCRHVAIGSYLLRAYMGSRWSHAAIWDNGQGYVYDTTLMQGGVKCSNEFEFLARYPESRIIDLQVDDLDEARKWLRAQVGKGYDWTALVGIFFRTEDWADENRWFCSELCAAFINKFVKPLFAARASMITPYHEDILTDEAYGTRH